MSDQREPPGWIIHWQWAPEKLGAKRLAPQQEPFAHREQAEARLSELRGRGGVIAHMAPMPWPKQRRPAKAALFNLPSMTKQLTR